MHVDYLQLRKHSSVYVFLSLIIKNNMRPGKYQHKENFCPLWLPEFFSRLVLRQAFAAVDIDHTLTGEKGEEYPK